MRLTVQTSTSHAFADPVGPVLQAVVALIAATHTAHEKLALVQVAQALRTLEGGGGDALRIGREAASVVITQVEAVDDELEGVERRVSEGGLDWTIIRRHMLLASRRHRLVALALQLEDLIHDLHPRGR